MRKEYYGLYALLIPFAIAALAILVNVTRQFPVTSTPVVAGGDPAAGRQAILDYGCGACHAIPGVYNANGAVGPSLDGITRQVYIAGRLQNNPDNLIAFIQHPQTFSPGIDMPELGVTAPAARDIAAYLYMLR